MKHLKLTLAYLTILLFSTQIMGQGKWALELRPSISFATKDIYNSDLEYGLGGELTISYRIMEHLAVYGGWSYNNFEVSKSFAGPNSNFEETGYTFGLQFIHPLGESRLSYLLRAGGTFNHIEVENNSGKIITDSGHGLGWQAEAGLVIPLTKNLFVIPGVRYRALNREIEINNVPNSVDLNYVSIGFSVSWSL